MKRAAVIVCSTRAAAGIYPDRTGPTIVEWLRGRSLETDAAVVVADGPDVAAALESALSSGVNLIVTTGGTGITATDRTPEATAAVLDRELPGFSEELRRRGAASTPFALMSRGLAGVAGGTFVVNLPGSTAGVLDGLALLSEILDHVLDQLDGGTHGE